MYFKFSILTLSILGKFSTNDMLQYFSYSLKKKKKKKGLALETICMKFQVMSSGKNKKNMFNLSSAELAQKAVKADSKDFKAKITIVCCSISSWVSSQSYPFNN